jgi:hypothetical protein
MGYPKLWDLYGMVHNIIKECNNVIIKACDNTEKQRKLYIAYLLMLNIQCKWGGNCGQHETVVLQTRVMEWVKQWGSGLPMHFNFLWGVIAQPGIFDLIVAAKTRISYCQHCRIRLSCYTNGGFFCTTCMCTVAQHQQQHQLQLQLEYQQQAPQTEAELGSTIVDSA